MKNKVMVMGIGLLVSTIGFAMPPAAAPHAAPAPVVTHGKHDGAHSVTLSHARGRELGGDVRARAEADRAETQRRETPWKVMDFVFSAADVVKQATGETGIPERVSFIPTSTGTHVEVVLKDGTTRIVKPSTFATLFPNHIVPRVHERIVIFANGGRSELPRGEGIFRFVFEETKKHGNSFGPSVGKLYEDPKLIRTVTLETKDGKTFAVVDHALSKEPIRIELSKDLEKRQQESNPKFNMAAYATAYPTLIIQNTNFDARNLPNQANAARAASAGSVALANSDQRSVVVPLGIDRRTGELNPNFANPNVTTVTFTVTESPSGSRTWTPDPRDLNRVVGKEAQEMTKIVAIGLAHFVE